MNQEDDVFQLTAEYEEIVSPFPTDGTQQEPSEVVDLAPLEQPEQPAAKAQDEFTYGEPEDCGPVRFEISDGIYVEFLEGVSYEQGVGELVANLGDEWAEALVIGAMNQGDGIWHIANGGGGFETL